MVVRSVMCSCMTIFILGWLRHLVSCWAWGRCSNPSPGNSEVLLSLPIQHSFFFIPGNRRHWRFYCIWTEDTPNKLPSFNLLFQSFLYLLIAALLLWDRMNWQKHFLDFLQNFNNSFTGGITLAVSQVAFIPSEKIYDFHKSMILKVCREKKHILNSAVMTNVGMILELLLVCQINVLIRL